MRRASLLVICLAGLSVVGNAFADDAGIWQFLLGGGRGGAGFGAPPPPSPFYWPAPSMAPMPRLSAAPRLRKKQVVHVKITRPKIIAHAETLPAKGPVSIYNDRTLQRGDSVMTAQGLRVFKGSSRFPYHASDFVPLAEASGFVTGNKKQLREVQLAFDRIDVPATRFAALVTGRSVATGRSDAKMLDVGGKKVRYVGP
jgi:hypothetical protein